MKLTRQKRIDKRQGHRWIRLIPSSRFPTMHPNARSLLDLQNFTRMVYSLKILLLSEGNAIVMFPPLGVTGSPV